MSTLATAMHDVTSDDMHTAIADAALPRLREVLATAGMLHRARVTDLPLAVMDRVCAALQNDERWMAAVLAERPAASYEATATKLIELRNGLEKPLVVFLPPGLRTAAEDSLDLATFQQISFAHLARDLTASLVERLPVSIRSLALEILDHLRLLKVVRDEDDEVRYLLTVLRNDATPRALGGALFAVGLVPDFELVPRGHMLQWLSRNREKVKLLIDSRLPPQERLGKLGLEPGPFLAQLAAYLRTVGSVPGARWTTAIAAQSDWHALSFDHWPFRDAGNKEELRLVLERLALPVQTQDQFGGAIALPVLRLGQQKDFKVTFRALPGPVEAEAWKSYRYQLWSIEDEGPVCHWESNNFAKPKKSPATTRALKTSEFEVLPEGSYFLRVEAYDADGAIITSHRPIDPNDAESRMENESGLFLLVRDTEVEPPTPRATFCPSFTDAYLAVSSRPLLGAGGDEMAPPRASWTGEWDTGIQAGLREQALFTLEGPEAEGYVIRLPGLLRRVEADLLDDPDHLTGLEVRATDARQLADVLISRRTPAQAPALPEFAEFLETRRAAFKAVREQHMARKTEEGSAQNRFGIVETADLLALASEIRAYGRAWCALVEAALAAGDLTLIATLAAVDLVEAHWPRAESDPGKGLLLGPTHPARMWWHLEHIAYGEEALLRLLGGVEAVPDRKAFAQALRAGLFPLNFPPTVFRQGGRGAYLERDRVTPFWSLYLPVQRERRIDWYFARANARRRLGLRGADAGLGVVPPEVLAQRMIDYLRQHPYVEQLRINVFNPGDGELVARALRILERERLKWTGNGREVAPELCYAVQLIAAGEQLDHVGEALDALLDPDRQVGEEDEFTIQSANHLRPKLLIARSPLEEFLATPESFEAHLSVLVEQFPVDARLSDARQFRPGAFVHGLIQEAETKLVTNSGSYGWVRGLNARSAVAEAAPRGMAYALQLAQRVQAVVAGGDPAREDIPTLALQLGPEDRGLLRTIHETCDQVLTVDRHLGLDFFDSAAAPNEVGYLLDFTPEFVRGDGERLLVTTKCTEELVGLIGPRLGDAGLEVPIGQELKVLETLRSLSGRLALRLLHGASAGREILGLLLARWVLERQGVLADRIVIPIDAHREWFGGSDDVGNSQSQSRADLLVVSLMPPVLDIRVIEVKTRSALTDLERSTLYQGMRAQAENTITRFRQRFDPDVLSLPRADRLLKAKELSSLLGFYLQRAARYGLVAEPVIERWNQFLETMEDGYQIRCEAMGIVYEAGAQGERTEEDEPGFPVIRFGADLARQLIGSAEPASGSLDNSFDSFRDVRDLLSVGQAPLTPTSPTVSTWEGRPQGSPPDLVEVIIPAAEAPEGESVPSPDPTVVEPLLEEESQRTEDEQKPATTVPAVYPVAPATGAVMPSLLAADGEQPWGGTTHVGLEPSPVPVSPTLAPKILLGANEATSQFGVLGKFGNDTVAVDLSGCNTISLFGVQGFGKSYTLGVISEMAVQPMRGINQLPSPLATVIFHYHKSDAYPPEFATAIEPNRKQREIERLLAEYSAQPQGLRDLVLLVPEAKVEQRRLEYPGIEVQPIRFSSRELGTESWKFLLGAYGNDAMYVRQMVAIMRRYRSELTLETFRQEIAAADLSPNIRRLAEDRIRLAEPYIDDSSNLREILRPGLTVIVDLRDEWVEKDEALGLFVVMMQTFAQAKHEGKGFNKLVVFDEAHKYITESDLIGQVVESIREMRHLATTVVIASQDPLSVPRAVVELTSILVLHRMTSPQWLKHLKGAIVALESLPESQLATLPPGEAFIWAQRSTDERITRKPHKVQIRPRVTQHGGGTKTAVDGETVR